jgi:hypothetical protein
MDNNNSLDTTITPAMQQTIATPLFATELGGISLYCIASDIMAGNPPHEVLGYLYVVKPYE